MTDASGTPEHIITQTDDGRPEIRFPGKCIVGFENVSEGLQVSFGDGSSVVIELSDPGGDLQLQLLSWGVPGVMQQSAIVGAASVKQFSKRK